MVRDWMEGQFEQLVENVDAWFEDLAVVRRDGDGQAPPPKFMAVLGALVRDLNELPVPTVAAMWRAAVRRETVPRQLLAQALGRARLDFMQNQVPNHARMGLIKAFCVRQGDGDMKPGLNPEHPSAAYHCGRLMAVLAALQYRALGDVGAGVVQRYYAAASSTPALVLGRLTRTSQFHLDKLEPGLRRWFDQRIASIWDGIRNELPRALTLEEQGLFALGYYHQVAFDRARSESKNVASAPSEDLEKEETEDV
jgi:CRISPR-associated protein Csd1